MLAQAQIGVSPRPEHVRVQPHRASSHTPGSAMPSGAESDLLQQVSVQLSGLAVSTVRTTAAGRRTLQINISDSSQDDPLHASSSSGGPPSPAGGEEAGGPSGTDGEAKSGLEAEDELPEWLGPLPPEVPLVGVLAGGSRLDTLDGLNGQQRLERAYRAGREAGKVLRRLQQFPAAVPKLSVSPRIYVVLAAPGLEKPVWCKTKKVFKELVGSPAAPGSIFIGFGSGAESLAYLAGAGIQGSVSERTA